MKRSRIAMLIALPMLAACSENATTAPGTSLLAHSESNRGEDRARAVPFDGRCETALTVVGGTASSVNLHITYVCQFEHLDLTTAVAEQVVTFTGPTSAVASNTTTYTAANGDQLYAAWTGTATSSGPDNTFSGRETYTGGTGRFAGASGSAWISGTASFATGTGQFTSRGTLRYAGRGQDGERDEDDEHSDHKKR
jgi:hypothetical protein